ncbi:hypothetical protein, partial [Paraclostridium bifermentans]
MKIFYDNIIFDLQRAGGISVYWYELIDRLLKNNISVNFIEHENSNNIFRKELNISEDKILREKRIPLKFLRYLSLKIK